MHGAQIRPWWLTDVKNTKGIQLDLTGEFDDGPSLIAKKHMFVCSVTRGAVAKRSASVFHAQKPRHLQRRTQV